MHPQTQYFRRRPQSSQASQPPSQRSTINLSQTTLLLAHFANLKLSADRVVHSTLSLTLNPPTLPLPTSARPRHPRRRRRKNVTVNKLSDADLEAELAARRAARANERDRYARAIRSEKLSVLEGELNRLRQELVRVGKGTVVSNGLHGTPPTARWEPLPERRRSAASNVATPGTPVPGTPIPGTPGAPPPPPPPGGDAPFTDPETRKREKEERQRRREAKRRDREANRKPLTLAEIIKSAGPDPMKRLKPPGSIPVPDIHAPEEIGQGEEELKDAREGLKKVSSATVDGEDNNEEEEEKEGDERKESMEKEDEGEDKEEEEKGENKEGEEKGKEGEEAADGKEKAEGKDGEDKVSEEKQEVDEETSKQEEEATTEAKDENINPANAERAKADSKPQTEATQTKVTPKSPKIVPTASENKQDDEQPASDEKPVSNESPTKINTPTNENTTKSPPKPPSQTSESDNKELKLPNGMDALAALSNLKLKLPVKTPASDAESNAADISAGNSDQSAAGSASDGPAPRPKTPARLSIEQKRRLRRAKKEDGVKME